MLMYGKSTFTFMQDEHTRFDDPVPWDPTHESDAKVPTLIHSSPTFIAAVHALCQEYRDIFCREVKPESAHVEPLQVDVDWERWRTPKHIGPPRAQSSEIMEEIRQQVERMQQLDLFEPSRTARHIIVMYISCVNQMGSDDSVSTSAT
jgi:hypothetical protein